MQLTSKEWAVAICTLLYVGAFSVHYLIKGNAEFLLYVAVLVFFFGLILATIRKTEFPIGILWGLSVWGLLHMAGGGITVGDTVLYGAPLIPIAGSGELFILKYDQAVHAFGFAMATLVMWHLTRPYLQTGTYIGYVLVALAGMGLGVVNELVEFAAVLIVPETGVGGYANTALDLVFNTIGAIGAVVGVYLYRRTEQKRIAHMRTH